MLFLNYEPKALKELSLLLDLTSRIREKFDTGADPDDLLRDVRILKAMYESLERALPIGTSSGNLARHLYFLEYYLELRRPEACRVDIDDMCGIDLPRLEKVLRSQNIEQHYDGEFADKLGPLLAEQHLDSAIRKAFIILKERLVHAFDLAPELDGTHLVNAVFGSQGCLAGTIPDSDRQAMRDLLAGLYGVFRNRYGHRDVDPMWSEAASVLGIINWALQAIDEYATLVPKSTSNPASATVSSSTDHH